MEAGLWRVLPPRFYTEGHYLTFEPPLPPTDPAPCGERDGVYVAGKAPPNPCGGEDPHHTLRRPKRWGDVPASEGAARSLRLRQNVELMRRQLHALRDAFAVAFLLNRTLILPHFDCLCDRSELVDYIPSCVSPGAPARLRFPLKCSTHFVLNIHKLLYLNQPVAHGFPPSPSGRRSPSLPFRAHAFLHDPQVSPDILASTATVRVSGAPPPLESKPRCSAPHDRTCELPLADSAARQRDLAHSDALKATAGAEAAGAGAEAAGATAAAAAAAGAAAEMAAAAVAGVGTEKVGTAVALARGSSDVQILEIMGSPAMRRTRLLRLSDTEGLLKRWEAQVETGRLFNQLETYFMLGGDFCCTSRRANEGRLYPADPPKLLLG